MEEKKLCKIEENSEKQTSKKANSNVIASTSFATVYKEKYKDTNT